jgi:DNA-binding MarR family transcriptional regulator
MPEDDVERLWSQFKALYRNLRRDQPSAEGLSPTQLQVLITVERSARPMSPGELATELKMTSPNMAAGLRSLEALDMVSRSRNPEDGRKAFVSATERGRKVVGDIRRSRRAWLRETVEHVLTDEERTLLFEAGHLMQRLADDIPRR